MQPAIAPASHPMQSSAQENAAEQSLREHLLAQVHSPPAPQHTLEAMGPSSSASPHDHNIDPAIAGSAMNVSNSADSGGDDNGSDSKKGGKRELSTSKRAAQNRAAQLGKQRAFRQRKEGYIKKLEEQVKDYNALNENYKAIQAENYQLRDYIINLQSRLIEAQGEYPQPPSNIDLPHPRPDPLQQIPAPTAPMGSSTVSQLQASAAQAVADLGSGKHHHEEAAYLIGNNYPSKRIKNGDGPQFTQAASDTLQRPDANGTGTGD
ncbi:MAG: hypothetical protein M1819_001735 [Sarea resinae]|nr:MAG: hypothetical protein M1819_001735 [Sarea resinae]